MFTQGDWNISKVRSSKDGNHTGDYRIAAKGTPKIATIHVRDVSVNQAKANAKLIKAAPKLYAACKEAKVFILDLESTGCIDNPDVFHTLREAITEAEESEIGW